MIFIFYIKPSLFLFRQSDSGLKDTIFRDRNTAFISTSPEVLHNINKYVILAIVLSLYIYFPFSRTFLKSENRFAFSCHQTVKGHCVSFWPYGCTNTRIPPRVFTTWGRQLCRDDALQVVGLWAARAYGSCSDVALLSEEKRISLDDQTNPALK